MRHLFRILNVGGNAKTVKNTKHGYLTGVLYLAPADLSGSNVCPASTAGCRAGCLNTAGKGMLAAVQAARVRKTQQLLDSYPGSRLGMLSQLDADIRVLTRIAAEHGLRPSVRLNGTSDIPWEAQKYHMRRQRLMDLHPDVQFYDYTKISTRMSRSLRDARWPANYHLTWSRTETNDRDCRRFLAMGGNVAVVYRGSDWQSLPAVLGWDAPVVNGDLHDCRHDDSTGRIVALKAKGPARADDTGFVVDV